MARRQRNELMAPAREERARRDEKRADALFDKRRESRVDAAFVARVHDMNLHSERACCHLQVFRYGLGGRLVLVYKNADHFGFRNKLVQQLQLLRL